MSHNFDPFEDDMRTGGRHFPPDPVSLCTCVPRSRWDADDGLCSYCEQQAELAADEQLAADKAEAEIEARVELRCNRCKKPMLGTTAYDGACACGGLIEAAEIERLENIGSRAADDVLCTFCGTRTCGCNDQYQAESHPSYFR